MNPKQKRFVAEYLKDQNGSAAAIRAGYSKKTSRQMASELLASQEIRSAVDAKLAKIEEKCEISTGYILNSLKIVAERCMQAVPVMVFDHEEKCMMPTGTWEFDSAGANRALELLGKWKKLFTEKIEMTDLTDRAAIMRARREKRKRAQKS